MLQSEIMAPLCRRRSPRRAICWRGAQPIAPGRRRASDVPSTRTVPLREVRNATDLRSRHRGQPLSDQDVELLEAADADERDRHALEARDEFERQLRQRAAILGG